MARMKQEKMNIIEDCASLRILFFINLHQSVDIVMIFLFIFFLILFIILFIIFLLSYLLSYLLSFLYLVCGVIFFKNMYIAFTTVINSIVEMKFQ